MRASKIYLHTLKEVSSEIEKTSEKLLIRGSMMRKVGGSYAYLPLGNRVIEKINKIAKKVFDEAGIQEFTMLSPASEEIYTQLVKKDLKSYKQLPFGFYQVQTGCRNLENKKGSIHFSIATFDKDLEGLNQHFEDLHTIYTEIFEKCGLPTVQVKDIHNAEEILSGKFVGFSDEGKEEIALCKECGYKATRKRARSIVDLPKQDAGMFPLEEVYTPNVKTIEELNQFLDVAEERLMKCLLLKGEDQFVAAFIRGDRDLNLTKLEDGLNLEPMTLTFAEAEDVERITGAKTGFAGPIGIKDVTIVVDDEVVQMKNAIAGGNKTDYHIKNVNYERDFKADYILDIKTIKEGDKCPNCNGHISIERANHLGEIKKLKTDYSQKIGATFIDAFGKEQPVFMGKYTLDITKVLSGIADAHHDESGIIWPMRVAPFHTIVTIVNAKKEEQVLLGEKIYKTLLDADIEVLLDDRNERAGAKFKDADLLGIPVSITVGKRAAEGIVEFKLRDQEEKQEITYDEAIGNVVDLF
ncbi:proline--tRNA ligase [Marinisporobacter balticus]|uniref:Proline--tRNA ligase n=1 Tax=Marinisporobacter balticus TaxID=2018667 RepID=A0A4V2S9Y3_9FIRM|nr:proline--tRNA ligase [Marinisporobacter balticus]TCO69670.1 prolyl-tRNA synthetase [Marinisporobacter balticus]